MKKSIMTKFVTISILGITFLLLFASNSINILNEMDYRSNVDGIDEFQILTAFELSFLQVTDTPDKFETMPRLSADSISTIITYTSSDIAAQSLGEIYVQRIFENSLIGPPICISDSSKHCVFNDISGSSIVYIAYEEITSPIGQVRVFDISTGDTIALTDYIPVKEARIHGDRVVWIEGMSGDTDIMLYDPALSYSPMVISSGVWESSIYSNVEIGEDFLVWEESSYGELQYDIWAYDLMLRDSFAIANDPLRDERRPSTSNHWFVWEERDSSTSNTAIVALNLADDDPITIIKNSYQNSNPSIDGRFIAYESNAAGNFDIYLYDLSEQDFFQVTTGAYDEKMPNIFDNYIGFVDITDNYDIFVALPNYPPVAVNDYYMVDGGNVLVVDAPGVLSNDYDENGDPLEAYLIYNPIEGTLVFSSDGSFTYTPGSFISHEGGVDHFHYRVGDGLDFSFEVSVFITVNRENRPPEAIDDDYYMIEDTILVIEAPGVLINDWDEEGDLLEAYILTGPRDGILVFNTDGSFIYTPNPNVYGFDYFTYAVSDGNGGTSTASVYVRIYDVNDAPIAYDDFAITDEDTSVIINLLANDVEVDGDILYIDSFGTPSSGIVVQIDIGTIIYTPESNFNGVDSFTYTVSDGMGSFDTATVSITVNSVNDAPILTIPIADQETFEDMLFNFQIPLNSFVDVDIGDILTYSATLPDGTPLPSWLSFDSSSRTFTGTPLIDDVGIYAIRVEVSDLGGLSTSDIFEIRVININDEPLARDDSVTINEDTSITVNVLANDADEDGDMLYIDSVGLPSNGIVIVNPDDTITYTPDANYNGPDSFSYTVTDGLGGFDTATVSITVNPVNDIPIVYHESISIPEDTTAPYVLEAFDVDGDPLTFIIIDYPNYGTLIGSGPYIEYIPDLNFYGVDGIAYYVNDGTVDSELGSLLITVEPVNDDPIANHDMAITNEDWGTAIDVLLNDSDIDGDVLTIISVGSPSFGTAIIVGDAIGYMPNENFNGEDSFSYTISDGMGGFATATVTIEVLPVNDAPLAVNDSYTVDEDSILNIPVPGILSNDFDVDSDPLSVVLESDVSHGTLILNPDGSFTYVPDANYYGTDLFKYRVNDGLVDSDVGWVGIFVNPVYDVPIAIDDFVTTDEDVTVVFDHLANDIDIDDVINGFMYSQPLNGTVTVNLIGKIIYTPDVNFFGTDSFIYKAHHGVSDWSNWATVTIIVNPVDDPPVAVDDTVTTDEDTSAIFDVLANDIEVDGDTLYIDSVGSPLHGTTSISMGMIIYTPDPNYFGPDSFTYTMSDGMGGFDTATVTVTVNAVNDAPVADVLGPDFSDEGMLITFDASDSTDIEGDQLQFRWDFNSDGIWDTPWISDPLANHIYTDNGVYTVILAVRDNEGGVDSDTLSVTVNNVAPTILLSGLPEVDEGLFYTLNLDSYDPGDDTIIQWVIDWGDGTIESYSGSTTSVFHEYADGPMVHTITVTGTDDDGAEGTGTLTVNVNNVAPTITPIADRVIDEDTQYTYSWDFTDPGVVDWHNYSIEWGDYIIDTGRILEGVYSLSLDHIYADPGTYIIDITITDKDGDQSTITSEVEVLDITPPTTDITLIGIDDNEGNFITDVQVELSPTDTHSGIANTYYRVDNGNWAVYSGSIPIFGPESHTIDYYSVDTSGNTEAFHTQDISIGGTIYIRPDGTIDPFDAPIIHDSAYLLTADLYANLYIVQDHTYIDGNGFKLHRSATYGIVLENVGGCMVFNFQLIGFECGIYLNYGDDMCIGGNIIYGSSRDSIGILLENYSDCAWISENEFIGQGRIAILVRGCRNMYISQNTFGSYETGIELKPYSDGAYIVQNSFIDTWLGIWMSNSRDNLIQDNTFTSPSLRDAAIVLGKVTHTMVVGNNINRYEFGVMSLSCSDNVISGNSLSIGYIAILLDSTTYTEVSTNHIERYEQGIEVMSSSNNLISGNLLKLNHIAIRLYYASTSDNILSLNRIERNNLGIEAIYSFNNMIYHNIFIQNYEHVFEHESDNIWYNDQLLEGNYWDTYTGVDDGSGNGKHAIAGDFIGDTNLPFLKDLYPIVLTTIRYTGTEGNFGWFRSEVTVEILVNNFIPIQITEYNINNEGWNTYFGPFDIIDEGIHTIQFRSIYTTGAVESIKTSILKIDMTAPTSYHTIIGPNSGSDPTYVSKNTEFWLDAYDNPLGSDIDRIEYRIATDTDPGVWITYTTHFNIEILGSYTIYYRSIDNAGNMESENSIWVIVNAVELTYTGGFNGNYSDPVFLSAILIDKATNLPISGKTILFTIGNQMATAITNSEGIASTTIILLQPGGTYTVSAWFEGEGQYLGTSDSSAFTLEKEYAYTIYTGSTVIPTTADIITLRATIFDDVDGNWGDLTKINITFKIYLVPIGSSDPFEYGPYTVEETNTEGVGVVIIDIPNLNEGGYLILINFTYSVNDYYQGPNSDLVVITVYKPTGSFVTGGGWIEDTLGTKGNFGFNVKYKKNGLPKGQVIYVYRLGEWEYIVKSNAWIGMAIDGTHAFFEAKCVVQQYNSKTGELVWSEGNYHFRIDVWDEDKDGGVDIFQIRVYDKIGLVYHEAGFNPYGFLQGGNIVIHIDDKNK